MKPFKELFRKNKQAEAAETPKEGMFTRYVTAPAKAAAETVAGLPSKIFGKNEAAEKTDDADLVDFDKMKEKLNAVVESAKKSKRTRQVLVVTGAGIAVAGMAADVMFLGGAGTLLVGSCLYGDLRNAQHIKKLSGELEKIDHKIESLRKDHKPVPDYEPALTAVKDRISEFQTASQKLPPEVATELAALKAQVEGLQQKIAPANDDGKLKQPKQGV